MSIGKFMMQRFPSPNRTDTQTFQDSWTPGWKSLGLVVLLLLMGCSSHREIKLAGKTMGTTYHITVIGGYFTAVAPLHKAIDERLAAINASMSTFQPDSEISRFNRLQGAHTPFPVDDDFQAVMKVSRQLFQITDGAWDGTLDPLIDLWGFGRTKRPEDRLPSAQEIQALLPRHVKTPI